MRKVVVNSTPLIVLCGIGRLDSLKEMYGEVEVIISESCFNGFCQQEIRSILNRFENSTNDSPLGNV